MAYYHPDVLRQPYGASALVFVDDFAGAGGSSQGLREAGLELLQAANHFDKALETHARNFPDADHLLTDLLLYDMRRRPRPHVYWASPECTWHSPAGGRKRPTRQAMLDMFEEYVPNAAGERSRLTMMQVVAFAEAKRPRVVIVENVVEVADWELFDSWLHAMDALGYNRQILCVSAAHVWSEFNAPAPQWRDRVYFVFYEKSINFPNVAPRPWAICNQCAAPTRARQAWKTPKKKRDGRRHLIGKYRTQYMYVCERHPNQVVEPLVAPAMNALDLTNVGTPIGDRKRPLAAATQRRIKVGAAMLGYLPELVTAAGNTWDAASPGHRNHGNPAAYYRVQGVNEPAPARTGTQSEALVTPFSMATNHSGADDGRPAPITDAPLPARSTRLGDALATPFLSHQYGERPGAERRNSDPTVMPLSTILATGGHHNLVTPMVVQRRDYDGPDTSRVHDTANQPLGARTAAGRGVDGLVTPMLAEYYGTGSAKPANQPIGTVSTREHHAMVTPAGGTWNSDATSVDEPLRTRTTKDMEGLAAAPSFVDVARRNSRPAATAADALATVTASGTHHGQVTPFISKHHGDVNYKRIEHMSKPITVPLPTIVAAPNVSLVTPSRPPKIAIDMDSLDAIDISDWHFRMLTWREHASAQRFPSWYEFTGNSSDNTLMAGNAVASNVAHYLGVLTRIALDDLPPDVLGYDVYDPYTPGLWSAA